MVDRQVLVTGDMGRVGAQDADDGRPLIVGELTDRRVLDEALDGVDAVVHLAGNPDPEAPWQALREPNVEGFAQLLAAAHDHGVRRVIFASSVHAMGAYEYRTGMSLIGLRMGLCTPEASPTEAVVGWLGPADLQQLVIGALDADVK